MCREKMAALLCHDNSALTSDFLKLFVVPLALGTSFTFPHGILNVPSLE